MKKLILSLAILAVAPMVLAQQFQKEQAGQIVNDLTFQVGRLKLGGDAPYFLSIMQRIDPAINEVKRFDFSEDSYRIAETVHINKYLSGEGVINFFGESEIQGLKGTEAVTLRAQYEGFELFALAKYPFLGGRLVAYGKAGATFTRAEYTISGTGSYDVNSGNLAIGAGVYGVIGRGLILRYDYFDGKADEISAKSSSLGMGFRF